MGRCDNFFDIFDIGRWLQLGNEEITLISIINVTMSKKSSHFRSRNDIVTTYWMIGSLLSSTSPLFLKRSTDHIFSSMDVWNLRVCVDGRMRRKELPFSSPLYFATAMARRDNALSITINSAWRPTSTSTMDGFGRAKYKYPFGVQCLQCSCDVVRN